MRPQLLNPIDDDEVEEYLTDPAYFAQEKIDGKHIVYEYRGGAVYLYNKKGEIAKQKADIQITLPAFTPVVLDGELVGNTYYVFDIIEWDNASCTELSAADRYRVLADLPISGRVVVVPAAFSTVEKRDLYARLKNEGKEGIVFKRKKAAYVPGRPASGGDMVKYKFYATASVIVSEHTDGKHSVRMMMLVDGGAPVDVGSVTIGQKTPLPEIGAVIEVKYLYAYHGGCLYQPSYLGVRDDVSAEECSVKQLKYKAGGVV